MCHNGGHATVGFSDCYLARTVAGFVVLIRICHLETGSACFSASIITAKKHEEQYTTAGLDFNLLRTMQGTVNSDTIRSRAGRELSNSDSQLRRYFRDTPLQRPYNE